MRSVAICLMVLATACTGDTGDADQPNQPATDPFSDGETWVPAEYSGVAPTRFVILGDSISEGVGAPNRNGAYKALLEENASNQWPDFDEADLESLYGTIEEVVDVSMGGATTDTLVRDQLPALERELSFPVDGPTIVVFTIGGNDLQGALNPLSDPDAIASNTLSNFEEIVTWLQDPGRFPDGVYIYATNVYEPSDAVGQVDECFFGFDFSSRLPVMDDFNADLQSLAKDLGYANVDLRGHFLGHGFYADSPDAPYYDSADPTQWFDADCIHPNAQGHHEIRRLFYGAMARSVLVE